MPNAIPEKNFLSIRVNNLWNSLTVDTRTSDSVLSFKKNIDRELAAKKYQYDE